MAERRTTTSDVELEVVLLTQDGKDKILNGESITIADVVDVNTSKYIKVRFRLNKDGLIFTASYIDGVFTHCYLSSIEINGIKRLLDSACTIEEGATNRTLTLHATAKDNFKASFESEEEYNNYIEQIALTKNITIA